MEQLTQNIVEAYSVIDEKNINPATKLFQLMQSWYTTHPKTLIPDDAWNRKLVAYGLDNKSTFRFTADKYEITVERSGMIAVIAYMSITDDLEFLQKLMEQHHIDTSDYDLLSVGKVDEKDTIGYTKLSNKRLSRSYIQSQLIGAILLTESGVKSVDDYLQREDGYIGLSVICSPQESLWPNTKIDEFYRDFNLHRNPNENIPMPLHARDLTEWHVKACDIPSPGLLDIMFRGGCFNINTRIDYGSQNGFLEDVFNFTFPELSHNVIKSFNEVLDDTKKTIISEKIIASLSLMSSGSQEGHVVAELMCSNLDGNIYPDVIGSLVLKLNMLEWPVEEKHITSPYHRVNQETLFSDLATEIMGIDPVNFRAYHFKALERFAKNWPAAHNNSDVDVHELVNHVMCGLDRYLCDPIITSRGKDFILDSAITRTVKFLKLAATISEPDYEKLNELPSAAKRVLCMNGYNIKKFTGMTHKDKGKVLCDELGM